MTSWPSFIEVALMLPRVLEPEIMDSPAEARDYNNMDHERVNRAFVDDLIAAGFSGGDVLDLGTGPAQIPLEIVRRPYECRIMAADAAPAMLDRARLNIEVAGQTQVIQLSYCDAKATPYASAMFDWVISNSLIHHLPDPGLALREAWRVTRPAGRLFFRDLLRPTSDAHCDQLVACYAADANEHQRAMFEKSLRAALTLDEIRDLVVALGCPADSVAPTSDRHWTWIAQR
jgi:ubiquinone/menaquinone biosynthesis C-methylase UbiE